MTRTTTEAYPPETYDLLIWGGTVFDGTGAEGVLADVAVKDDRIVAVGDLRNRPAGRTIDATGLVVAPGFIDIHTHSDISATYAPDQASAVSMGVTTQITGNCGLSIGLIADNDLFAFEKRWLAPHGARIRWDSFDAHLRYIADNGIATNFLTLTGHGTLRKRVMGEEDRPPTPAELTALQHLLVETLEAGSWGLSSGLEYPPSSFADTDELAALCDCVKEYGSFYATHLRNEGDTLVESVQEALHIVERAGVPLQLSHHKAEGRANWGKIQTTLQMVEAARARGLDVQMDQYPYTAFMTSLAIQVLPRRVLSGSVEEIGARLSGEAQRAAIASEMRTAHPDWDNLSADSPWENIQIGVCRGHPELQGRSVASLAREAHANPIDYVLDLLAETTGYLSAVNFAIGEADIAEVMRYPWTAIGSDGVGTHPGGTMGEDRIHPRAYGTFPRVLGRYVRELGVLTTAQAIHKMTGLPAARMGLTTRGRIAPGYSADLTLYHPDTIADHATFDAPHQFSNGVAWVLVNGRIALENGQLTDARAGVVLRRQ